jgi:hypothetical protein
MGRKKRVVEGAILDLTGSEPVVVMGELVETPVEPPPPVKKVDEPKQEVRLTQDEIREMILSMRQTCNHCGVEVYHALRKWGGQNVCSTCYDIEFDKHCIVFNNWLREEGIKGCAFCGKVRINPSEFHFDHVNMFEKKGTVGTMLFDGVNMDTIKEEVKKCQLLCVGCHAIVTKMENRLGFTYLKRKKRRQTTVKREDYMPIMSRVYDLIKEIRGGGGGDEAK